MAYQQDYRNDPVTGGATGGRAANGMEYSRGARTDRSADEDDVPSARDDTQSAAIERDIDRTRSRMDQTVETLADRLRPANIVGDLLDYFATDDGMRTESGQGEKVKRVARRAGRGVWETVKANPMPSALIAGGIAWMVLKGNDEDDETDDGYSRRDRRLARRRHTWRDSAEPMMYGQPDPFERYGDEYAEDFGGAPYRRQYGESSGGMMSGVKHAAGSAIEGVRHAAGWVAEKAGDAAGAVGEAASSAAHKVGDAAGGMASRTGEAMSSGRRTMGHAAGGMGHAAEGAWESTRHGLSSAARSARDWSGSTARSMRYRTRSGYDYSRQRFNEGVHEYPLAMSVAALAAGVLAGLAIPRTRREDQMFGMASHELKDRVGDVASEAWDRARDVAHREGLEPGSLKQEASGMVGRVSEAASRVVGAAVESARHVVGDVKEQVREEARGLKDEVKHSSLSPTAIADAAKHVAKEAARGAKEEGEHQLEQTRERYGRGSTGPGNDGGTSGGTSGGAFTTTSSSASPGKASGANCPPGIAPMTDA